MRLINIGCGNAFVDTHEWVNVDIIPCSKNIIKCNIVKGLSFDDNSFDVVYHSNVLEHLSKEDGIRFIQECYRILKPGGIIRIGIPDLESIVREYLKQKKDATENIDSAVDNYEWMMIELIDQMTRRINGGLMHEYLMRKNIHNLDFITNRIGIEVVKVRNELLETSDTKINEKVTVKRLRNKLKNGFRKLLLGEDYEYFKYAKFIKQGEIHQWMYDDYSLSKLLETCKFSDITRMSSFQSAIIGWSAYKLDFANNAPLKPDTLYIEAKK